jgi:hypothetical protein
VNRLLAGRTGFGTTAGLINSIPMSHIIFDDYREPAAALAYEIAFDFLERAGLIRDEFEASVFLAQRLTTLVEEGGNNKIRMANRVIADYQVYVAECACLIRSVSACEAY